MPDDTATAIPAVPFLVLEDGGFRLTGVRCGSCGAVYCGTRAVCGACGSRQGLAPISLAQTGRLYAYSIVYRSFPGVATPFVAAVMDLDGGGSLKGVLIGVDPEPDKIPFDMRLRVVVRDTGQCNAAGKRFAAYFFEPAEAA